AEAMSWTYKVSQNGYFAVLSDKETDDKTMSKLCDKATEQIGIPKDMLLKSSLIFRAGSDKVIKNGEEVTLEDSEGLTYAPMVDGDTYYLPVDALKSVFGDSVSIEGNVIQKDDVNYISAKEVAEIMKYTT